MKFTICLLVLVALFVNIHAFPGGPNDKVKGSLGKEAGKDDKKMTDVEKKVEGTGKQGEDKAKNELGDMTDKAEGMMGGDKDDKKKSKNDDKKPDSDKPKDGDDDKKQKKLKAKAKPNKKNYMKKMMKPVETAEKGMETEMKGGMDMMEGEMEDCEDIFGL